MPGVNRPFGLANCGAAADRAGRAVDHVVDEIHAALVGEVLLVDQLAARPATLPSRLVTSLPPRGEPLVAQIGGLVEGELEADRIDRHDGGEQRGVAAGAAGHEIAGRHAAVADAAGDRRAQLGELEIELGLSAPRPPAPATEASATRLAWVRWSKVCSVMVLSRTSCWAAREIGFGEGEIGLRLREIGARLGERVLERPLVDGEQQIALLDHLAVREMDLVEIAGDAGAHLDRVDRDEAADIFVLVDDGALDRLGDRHGRRRRRGRLLLAARRSRRAAAHEQQQAATAETRER